MGICMATKVAPGGEDSEDRRADEIDIREFADGDKMLILMKENHEMIKTIFNKFDANDSSKINSAELRTFLKVIFLKQSKWDEGTYHQKLDRIIDRAFVTDEKKAIPEFLGVFEFSMWLQTAMVARFMELRPEEGRRLPRKKFEKYLRALAGKGQGKDMSFQELQIALRYLEEYTDPELSVSRFVHVSLHLMREHMSGIRTKANTDAAKFKKRVSKRQLKAGKQMSSQNGDPFNGSWMAHLVAFDVSDKAWKRSRQRVTQERKFYRIKSKKR
mmetsp:Transcript_44111/g.70868  ORF Transcript_44111/g.70868 Transcript_44111/m.70868 type:complete len:272 (+) Transcript_44111:173-988(+)